jgi:preprotein translocase subunit SecE
MANKAIKANETKTKRVSKGMRKHARRIKQEARKTATSPLA